MAVGVFQEDNWSHLVSLFGRYRNFVLLVVNGASSFSYNFTPGSSIDPDGIAAMRYRGTFFTPGGVTPNDLYFDILPNRPTGVILNIGANPAEGATISAYILPYRENPLGFPGFTTLEEGLLGPTTIEGIPFYYPLAGVPAQVAIGIGSTSLEKSYTVIFHTDPSGRLSGWTSNGEFTPVSWVGI